MCIVCSEKLKKRNCKICGIEIGKKKIYCDKCLRENINENARIKYIQNREKHLEKYRKKVKDRKKLCKTCGVEVPKGKCKCEDCKRKYEKKVKELKIKKTNKCKICSSEIGFKRRICDKCLEEKRKPIKELKVKKCVRCGEEFGYYNGQSKYCDECKYITNKINFNISYNKRKRRRKTKEEIIKSNFLYFKKLYDEIYV